jgi:hypothetical protein
MPQRARDDAGLFKSVRADGGMSGSLADEIDLRFFEHGGRLDLARAL